MSNQQKILKLQEDLEKISDKLEYNSRGKHLTNSENLQNILCQIAILKRMIDIILNEIYDQKQ